MIIIYTACGCNAIGQQTTHLQVVLGDNVTHAPNKISVPVTMATEVLHQQGKFYANKGKSQQDVVVCNLNRTLGPVMWTVHIIIPKASFVWQP